MLSKQFLLKTQLPDHINKTDLDSVPRRLIRRTPVSSHGARVKELIPEEVLDLNTYETGYENHTKQCPYKTPDVSSSEEFPRGARTTLEQLR